MRKKGKGISAGEKRKEPKRVIRKLSVSIWVGSLLGSDQLRIRGAIPKSWKLKSVTHLPVSRVTKLDFEVLITD